MVLTDIGNCLRVVAPLYNLVLVVLVVMLFIKLLSLKNKGVYIIPWRLLFFALCVYIIEEILAVMDIMNVVDIPDLVFPLLETIMVSAFIYLILLQREYLKKPEQTAIKSKAKRK